MFDPREKIALFIDGANLYATSRALGFDIDYRKLLHMTQWMYLTGWAVANRTAPPAREPGFKLER